MLCLGMGGSRLWLKSGVMHVCSRTHDADQSLRSLRGQIFPEDVLLDNEIPSAHTHAHAHAYTHAHTHLSQASASRRSYADMLEVGNLFNPLGDAEGRSHFSMWAVMKAPLLIGTDVTNMTAATLSTLTNAEVIAINQDEMGVQATMLNTAVSTYHSV